MHHDKTIHDYRGKNRGILKIHYDFRGRGKLNFSPHQKTDVRNNRCLFYGVFMLLLFYSFVVL